MLCFHAIASLFKNTYRPTKAQQSIYLFKVLVNLFKAFLLKVPPFYIIDNLILLVYNILISEEII